MTVQAHAKLNVFLRVLGRRTDGYHDLESLILPLDLADAVTVTAGGDRSLTVDGPTAAGVPDGDDNLALRAAAALAGAVGGSSKDASIRIDKRIPVAAGMGGGSADAAATIRALDRLWACGLDIAALAEVAAAVGSDVPALVRGGAVFVSGRGEAVEPVHALTTWWVVRPFPFAVRTPAAFAWWDADGETGPDGGAVIAALETGNDDLLGSALFNDLQPGVVALARHLGHADELAAAVPDSFVTSGPPPAIIGR